MATFEDVRDLPYALDGAHDAGELQRLGRGDCLAKADLLARRLADLGQEIRLVRFSYKLPSVIPEVEALVGGEDLHRAVQMRVGRRWILVDATHDLGLAGSGLTVARWDGRHATEPAYPPTGPILVEGRDDNAIQEPWPTSPAGSQRPRRRRWPPGGTPTSPGWMASEEAMARRPSPAFLRIRSGLAAEVLSSYQALGQLTFCYALGSLVEGLADQADLDVMVVWKDAPPRDRHRAVLPVADPAPIPEYFDQEGFVLDRFWFDGQQLDLKHVSLAEVDTWITRVEAGGGMSGYPTPLIALHGLRSGELLVDPEGEGARTQLRVSGVPETVLARARQAAEPAALEPFLKELRLCVQRGDGLLFVQLAGDVMRRAYISWFLSQGLYWPHEKRLQRRLADLGRADLAKGDALIWNGTLDASMEAIEAQITRLRS